MDSQPPTRTRPRRAFLGSTAAIAAVGGCLRLQSDQDGSGGETTVAEDGGGGTDTTGRRTMRIGFLLPLSGTLSEFGSRMRNAADLPLRQLEQDPNVELTVETRVADTGSTVERGLQAGEELLSAGYPAVVGPATSSLSMEAASQVFGAVESVACSPSATSPTITTVEDDDFVFRTAPSATFRGVGTGNGHCTTVDGEHGRGAPPGRRVRTRDR